MKMFSSMLKCGSMLLFMFSFLGTVAADGPPSRKIKEHNWENSMGPGGWSSIPGQGSGQMCVDLLADNILNIKLYINIKHPNFLANMRPMKFKYTAVIDGIPLGTGYTPIAQVGDFVAINNNGNPDDYYKATYHVPYDLTEYCRTEEGTNPPFNEHDFTITYQLIYIDQNNNEVAYPVGSYPDAWPAGEYTIPNSLNDEPYSDTKNVCCYNIKPLKSFDEDDLMATDLMESLDEGLVKDAAITQANAGSALDVLIRPNPFNNELKIQFKAAQFGNASIDLLDTQGKLVIHRNHLCTDLNLQTQQLNTSSLSPGVYYLRITCDEQTQVVKLVKADN